MPKSTSTDNVYAELGIPLPDHATHVYAMAAELLSQQSKGSVTPPSTEVFIRGLDSIAHWFRRQEPTPESAWLTFVLVLLLCQRYDLFWDVFWAVCTRGDLHHQAATFAVARGIQFRSYAEADWWLINHRPPGE